MMRFLLTKTKLAMIILCVLWFGIAGVAAQPEPEDILAPWLCEAALVEDGTAACMAYKRMRKSKPRLGGVQCSFL
jgi:hypothetical protein